MESFEELKTLFEDMFQDDLASINSSSQSGATASCSSSLFDTFGRNPSLPNKRNFEQNSVKPEPENSFNFDTHFQGFSFGVSAISTLIPETFSLAPHICRIIVFPSLTLSL